MNKRPQKQWIVYLVRCVDGSLYCGITNNLNKRLEMHNAGKGARYTRSRQPVELVGVSPEMTKSDALKLEYRTKQLPAGMKIFELKKRMNISKMILKNELLEIHQKLNKLVRTVSGIMTIVEEMEPDRCGRRHCLPRDL